MKYGWSLVPKLTMCSLLLSAGVAYADNPQLVPVLKGLLQKYQRCILESYENDMSKTNPRALGPLRDGATCVAGNICTIQSRRDLFNMLQAQANRGDATNFQTNLQKAILADCFQCTKHSEFHTKQVHCTEDCNGNQNWSESPFKFDVGIGPCFEGCKAGVDMTKLARDIANDIQNVFHSIVADVPPAQQQPPQATGGVSVATNYRIMTMGPAEQCDATPSGYFIAPAELLDWNQTAAPPFMDALTNYHPPDNAPSRPAYNPAALANPDRNVRPNIGANEGRLRADLRNAAARRNPVESLCRSAEAFSLGNASDGNAFADLSVTGRRAYAAFRAQPPQEAQIFACLQNNPRTKALSADVLQLAATRALDRAYQVAKVIRTGGWAKPGVNPERQPLGYIAVSGEDDQPHRPVNVPSAEFPQYDLDVQVPVPNAAPILVHTRYMIAHTFPPQVMQNVVSLVPGAVQKLAPAQVQSRQVDPAPSTEETSSPAEAEVQTRKVDPAPGTMQKLAPAQVQTPPGGSAPTMQKFLPAPVRTLPADLAPVLAQDAIVFLYIPGMDSRLEEALDIAHALHALGRQRNKNYTVISMDLPTSGYADNIDYNRIAPLTAAGRANGLGFAPNKYVVPIVDFDENFIVNFVNTLDRSTGVTHREIYPIGGSLGGNMAFRLGRPRPDAPWIKSVVPWSPAAIWPSIADSEVKHVGLAVPWYLAGGDPNLAQETPGSRRSFFFGGFDWESKVAYVIPAGGGKPQSEFWYANNWPCKQTHLKLARIERYETYDHYFRLWHWRLGMEQLLFSQQIPIPGTSPQQPLYLRNTKRMLLMCGIEDIGAQLCEETRKVAPHMEMTPGRAVFLTATGHSIHNERPNFLAQQIVDFVEGR
jgi:pimeloyl-ACP methyl ester carboxylesterase